MHYAVKGGHVDVIELLLSLVPDMLNQQRSNGQTPLFDAFERPAIVQLLLSRVRRLSLATYMYGCLARVCFTHLSARDSFGLWRADRSCCCLCFHRVLTTV